MLRQQINVLRRTAPSVHHGDRVSDMTNLSRAKDAGITWARPRGLSSGEVARWHRRDHRDVPLAANATIFMVNRLPDGCYYRTTPRQTVAICAACLTDKERAAAQPNSHICIGRQRSMVACVPVFRKATCSNRCEQLVARARRRLAKPKVKTICVSCKMLFEPTRSDSRFCSSACRQAAYRARAAVPDK
jgi:hypothetical protein